MTEFIGRSAELETLDSELDAVRSGGERPGRCILLRGRRRVGKSRLLEQFIDRAGVPSLFYAASGGPVHRELAQFAGDVSGSSSLPGRDLFHDVEPRSWEAALRLLADALPDDAPSVVVLDEVPYLVQADPSFEGALQRVWDRSLSRRPLLLILVGSDLAMIEAMNSHGRPFHQRGRPMVLGPLNPAEVGRMLGLDPARAIDAFLVTGGLPLICAEWPQGAGAAAALKAALSQPLSALGVSAELSLAAEFAPDAHARTLLSAIGSGERTRVAIGRAAGLPTASLDRGLRQLIDKRVVAAEQPLSTRPSRETRYRIDDPYLRFWLRFVGPHREELDRGRADLVLDRIERGWTSWRGRAVESVVRDALRRLTGRGRVPDAGAVGGYWTRSNDVEVDLVGADRMPVAKAIGFVGSVKWLERSPFDHHDLGALLQAQARVPGAEDAALVVVSRAGSTVAEAVTATLGPAEIIHAWPG